MTAGFLNVCAVVEINEAVSDRLSKDDPDQGGQSKANADDFPNRRCAVAHLLESIRSSEQLVKANAAAA
jgi:hypothetical protein